MTGIQALERAAPTKPTSPGYLERREFEYRRHRTQADFATPIAQTIALDPAAH